MPAIAAVIDLDKAAVACGIDLHRHTLRHGLACCGHSEDDAAQNSGSEGQCSEVDHGKIPPIQVEVAWFASTRLVASSDFALVRGEGCQDFVLFTLRDLEEV